MKLTIFVFSLFEEKLKYFLPLYFGLLVLVLMQTRNKIQSLSNSLFFYVSLF